MNCNEGTNIPELLEEECNGIYTSTNCIIYSAAISYLNLPPNSSLTTIILNLVLANQAKDELIAGLNDRLTILENA